MRMLNAHPSMRMKFVSAREKVDFCETNPIFPPSTLVSMVYAHDLCASFLAFFCETNPISSDSYGPSSPLAAQQELCRAEDLSPTGRAVSGINKYGKQIGNGDAICALRATGIPTPPRSGYALALRRIELRAAKAPPELSLLALRPSRGGSMNRL